MPKPEKKEFKIIDSLLSIFAKLSPAEIMPVLKSRIKLALSGDITIQPIEIRDLVTYSDNEDMVAAIILLFSIGLSMIMFINGPGISNNTLVSMMLSHMFDISTTSELLLHMSILIVTGMLASLLLMILAAWLPKTSLVISLLMYLSICIISGAIFRYSGDTLSNVFLFIILSAFSLSFLFWSSNFEDEFFAVLLKIIGFGS